MLEVVSDNGIRRGNSTQNDLLSAGAPATEIGF